jgi:hypothetical protein
MSEIGPDCGQDRPLVAPRPALEDLYPRKDSTITIIAIEEHWNSAGIRDALDRLPGGARTAIASGNAEALFHLVDDPAASRPGLQTHLTRRSTPS